MNPPEVFHPKQKKFCLTFEVTEGKTTGSIISFDHVSSSIISSLSSGALADHSSLSESSESLHHLPVHSSTSTNSSGLSASRTAKRPPKPCQCCNVLNYLKLNCVCGHGNLLFVRDVSSKDGAEAKEGARHPEVCSDMDLTDPVISERTSSTDAVTPSEDTQDSQPFPRIRLSIRPECKIAMAVEEEFEELPIWWRVPEWEHLMAFPDELPVHLRPPMVPSHYKEDKRSRFLTLLWISRTIYAHNTGSEPPLGVTRVFYDPRFQPELPKEIYSLLDKFSDYEIIQILKRFEEIRHLAKKSSQGECQNDSVHSTTVDEPPSCPRVAPNQPAVEVLHSTYGYDFVLQEIDEGEPPRDRCGDLTERTQNIAAEDNSCDKITLVYAKFQKWYYPGVMECSMEEWDNATQHIMVQFYDGSPSKDLSPDLIFPLQRLVPGTNFQLQLEDSVYEDVLYVSFAPSLSDSGMPSATVNIISEGTPMTSVPFHQTALSPKDIVQIRSTLKTSFYPSRYRRNFTELSTGAILDYPSRRARDDPKKKVQQVPSKRKKEVSEKISSSSETAVSPKRPKPPLTEPSSTDGSFTSPEESLDKAYLCTADGCGMLFDTERQLLAHREKIKKQKKRRHKTMQVVSRSQLKPPPIPKDTDGKISVAGTSRPGGSRCVTVEVPQPQNCFISDSETDSGSSYCTSRWSKCVQGYGLSPEKCQLSDKVKSFKKLKGENKTKCPPQTNLFSSQHFVLTNGSPPHTFKKPRKRALDSESESTDVENYYSTSLEFEVLKLQQAIECGGGRIYTDFSDVPAYLRKDPGHDLIVVSSHPTCTVNYIYGVVLGCTIIRHDTILDCVRKGKSLRDALSSGSAILLPPGWCEVKMTWAPPRASRVKPLTNLMFFLALRSNPESKSFWCSLILHLGGKPIALEETHQVFARLDSTINGIVADPEVARSLAGQANKLGVPIVNTAWIIQAVITGSRPPFSAYKVTVVDSSS